MSVLIGGFAHDCLTTAAIQQELTFDCLSGSLRLTSTLPSKLNAPSKNVFLLLWLWH
jgi:hypothetical protein